VKVNNVPIKMMFDSGARTGIIYEKTF